MDPQSLTIGELARRAGVSADTIRYYERIGVMPPACRTSARFRRYEESTVSRVKLIQNALRFGFTLQQVRSFIAAGNCGAAPSKQVRAIAAQILEAIEREIGELIVARDSIREKLADWDRQQPAAPQSAASTDRETKSYLGGPRGLGGHPDVSDV